MSLTRHRSCSTFAKKMKHIITSTLILIAANLLQAAEYIPSDVQRIIDIRETETMKIDEQYCAALEKLKVRYTQKGKLDYVLLIDKLIKDVEKIPNLTPNFIGHTYAKPSNKAPFSGREAFTFLEAGKVKRADGQIAGWDRLGNRQIRVWKGKKKDNPMTWTFDETFKHADVYSPYHRTTVKAALNKKQ